ncbi:ImmA/IrrE family metallo-endopeptidase [Brevibacterium sp. RIT 803]|uniref:ImmA/IrrE family metallo-endopeptidase n=1 Tax=Brevibacterium sp. RIT 803 TaxID=2810210 RepID=UPI00194EC6EB|nr:ImmA/IrrE family metallo-endopeptidase [Brevibacterium sp. RIT 803]MBM6588819.1 ImmA/IrrE family metallo-endopeptidase [Brevibacterium sp. RIT 803]
MNQLQTFAKWTRVPFGKLFLAKPPEEALSLPDFRTVNNRAPEPSADLIDTIRWVEVRRDWYVDYLRRHHEDPVEWVGSVKVGQSPRSVADQIRNTLGLKPAIAEGYKKIQDAINSISQAIENVGGLVLSSGVVAGNNRRPLDTEDFRGFSVSERWAPLIFVNGADTKNGQVFTLAHELAHLFSGTSGVSNPDYTDQTAGRTESWCNRVAAELLVPKEAHQWERFDGQVPRGTLDTLSRQFNVSTVMILVRLKAFDCVTKESFEKQFGPEVRRARKLAREAKLSGKSGGGNWYSNQAIRLGKTIARSLAVDTYEGGTTYGEALRIAGTRRPETFNELARTVGV